jgi:hypothetical protein
MDRHQGNHIFLHRNHDCGTYLAGDAFSSRLGSTGLAMWSASRFYYVLFYVLEKYVDPDLRYAGLLALAAAIRWKRLKAERHGERRR